MSGELADGSIARVEANGRVLSGGSDVAQLEQTMERHAPEPEPEAKGTAAAQADGKPAEAAPAQEKPTRGQQRFSELAKARDDAKAEAAAAKAEREALAKERDELKARLSQPPAAEKPPTEPQKKPAAASAAFPTEEEWFAKPENEGNNWYDYSDARAEHRYQVLREQERRDEAAQAATRTYEEALTKFRADEQVIRAELTDYDTKMAAIGPHDVSLVVQRAVMQLSPRVAYHLASNLGVLRELTAETLVDPDNPAFPAAVAATKRYLSTLIAEPAKPSAAPARPFTPPPAPFQPVNGNSATVATPSSELPKKGDFDAYRNQRAKERGVKPRY